MILPRAQINRVLRGEKQQHRVPATTRRAPWKVGATVAITRWAAERGDQEPTACYVRVTSVYQQGLHEVSEAEATAEGFDSRDDLFDHWRERYHTGPLAEPLIWVMGFELVEMPRLLHRNPGAPGASDYTHSHHQAMPDEPEAVDDDALECFAREARAADEACRRRQRADRPLPDRVAEVERAAKAGDQRAQRQLFVIRQRVDAHERGEPRGANGGEKAA